MGNKPAKCLARPVCLPLCIEPQLATHTADGALSPGPLQRDCPNANAPSSEGQWEAFCFGHTAFGLLKMEDPILCWFPSRSLMLLEGPSVTVCPYVFMPGMERVDFHLF